MVIVVTFGDPVGVGLEIVVKLFVGDGVDVLVVGDVVVLCWGVELMGVRFVVCIIIVFGEVRPCLGMVDVL